MTPSSPWTRRCVLDRHIHVVKDINELYKRADYVTIHIHYTKETEHMIDAKAISRHEAGRPVHQPARGEIVDDDRHALRPGHRLGGPPMSPTSPTTAWWARPIVIAMPHLGASTPESEQNCAVMAVDELRDYLENGNIRNSVKHARRQPGAQRRVPAVPAP